MLSYIFLEITPRYFVETRTYHSFRSHGETDDVLVLTRKAYGPNLVVRLRSGSFQLRHRDEGTVADGVAELEVRVHLRAVGVRYVATHRTLDPVRAQDNVRSRSRTVLEMHDGSFAVAGDVCAPLVEVCTGGIDVFYEGLKECGAVNAI